MSLDLPSELNKLKEEEETVPYNPPYEENQAVVAAPVAKQHGEDHNSIEDQEPRVPNVPPLPHDDSPTGGVDRRGQSGDQGDDELHDFHDQGA
jgi:hypothetical protein